MLLTHRLFNQGDYAQRGSKVASTRAALHLQWTLTADAQSSLKHRADVCVVTQLSSTHTIIDTHTCSFGVSGVSPFCSSDCLQSLMSLWEELLGDCLQQITGETAICVCGPEFDLQDNR